MEELLAALCPPMGECAVHPLIYMTLYPEFHIIGVTAENNSVEKRELQANKTENPWANIIIKRQKKVIQMIKGKCVQCKLTGVLSGINRKLMICHCSDGYSFFNL
jgi:hypothetical protein